MSDPPRVVILGAGPAGLGTAWRLTRENRARVTIVERNAAVGGNAGSFELAGIHVDYGSHRLHPACDPAILEDIRQLLGSDLIDRPRHGRIRLQGRWIHFPLKPLDLLRSAPPRFLLKCARDALSRAHRSGRPQSFASVLEEGLGPTICHEFYFPYARKIWGVEPEELSADQARRRVQAGSFSRLAGKVVSALPGVKGAAKGRFYYPRNGYGQISQAYHEAAQAEGTQFRLRSDVQAVVCARGKVEAVQICGVDDRETLPADHVWSTIPVTTLVRMIRPSAPEEVLQAAGSIRFRGMVLIYLVLGRSQFTEFDAHYFPEADVPITRLSEPRNYSQVTEPPDRTVLCAELPCNPIAGTTGVPGVHPPFNGNDPYWNMSDGELGTLVTDSLARAGLPVPAPVLEVVTRRLPHAYPIYDRGYETALETIHAWLEGIAGLLTFGRQGLFAHDNTHHTLAMAYAAVECLTAQGEFDRTRWTRYQEIFKTHVVED
jgi:protoporphyrinogen oxidase